MYTMIMMVVMVMMVMMVMIDMMDMKVMMVMMVMMVSGYQTYGSLTTLSFLVYPRFCCTLSMCTFPTPYYSPEGRSNSVFDDQASVAHDVTAPELNLSSPRTLS